MGRTRELNVWGRAMDLAEQVYAETQAFPPSELYGLVSQMRRAAVSIPSNIAEGEGRTGRDPLRFLDIAYGSLLELETQLELSRRLGFLPDGSNSQLTELTAEIGRMLNGLKAARRRALKPDP